MKTALTKTAWQYLCALSGQRSLMDCEPSEFPGATSYLERISRPVWARHDSPAVQIVHPMPQGIH